MSEKKREFLSSGLIESQLSLPSASGASLYTRNTLTFEKISSLISLLISHIVSSVSPVVFCSARSL